MTKHILFGTAACFAVVDEIKEFGVQAYVQALGDGRKSRGGQAYIRLKWDDFEPTGGKAKLTEGAL
mgnify:CR=1 FL=1